MRKNNVTNVTKKVTLMILCAAMMLGMAACGEKQDKTIGAETAGQTVAGKEEKIPTDGAATTTTEEILIGDNTQIPNPFTDCDTLADAAARAGFDIIVPDSVEGYEDRVITAIENEMIQVMYLHGEDEICVRKAAGEEDCSGDYNEYSEEKTVTVGDREVTLRGNNGKVMVAVWSEGGYSYSIGVYAYTQYNDGVADPESNSGMAEEAVTALAAQIQ